MVAHAGFRNPCPDGREGSSPSRRTMNNTIVKNGNDFIVIYPPKWAAEWGRVDILKMWEETGIFNEMDEKQWQDLLLWSIISRASEAKDIAEVLKYLVSISNIAKNLIGPISEKWNYGKYLEIFNHFNK